MDGTPPAAPPITDVRDAIRLAKDYVKQVFADERLSDVGLEETVFDPVESSWRITIGFSRPWNAPTSPMDIMLERMRGSARPSRTFKIVDINQDGVVTSMKNRLEDAAD